MKLQKIIAYGPVIVEEGRLLVTKDKKDPFYKIPGGRAEGNESPIEVCLRELNEETGFNAKIGKKLSTMILDKKPGTNEDAHIELNHYLAELTTSHNYSSFFHNDHYVRWLNINEIKSGKYDVAPNILYLIEKGDIK